MRYVSHGARRVVTVIAGLLLISWGLFFGIVLPGGYHTGTTSFGIGLAVTAFVLGLRHAFDADHIAAIDSASRKLVADSRDPSSVGLWFALGHSTVVLLAVGLVIGGFRALTTQIGVADAPLAAFTTVWGPTFSSVFLLVLAAVNIGILSRMFRRRTSEPVDVEADPAPGGLVSTVLARVAAPLDRPWKMFAVGLLFGLGFDTASTITLLLLAGGAGIAMPWYAAMVLPVLFTAGMVMGDGVNSVVTARMYAWSVDQPQRRRHYNGILIALSAAVALVVGTVGLCGVLVDTLGVHVGPISYVADVDLTYVGAAIVGVLLLAWLASAAVERSGRADRPTALEHSAAGDS